MSTNDLYRVVSDKDSPEFKEVGELISKLAAACDGYEVGTIMSAVIDLATKCVAVVVSDAEGAKERAEAALSIYLAFGAGLSESIHANLGIAQAASTAPSKEHGEDNAVEELPASGTIHWPVDNKLHQRATR